MRVVGRAAVHGPMADAVRDFTRDGGVERLSFSDRRLKFLRRVFAQIGLYRFVAEHVGAEVCCRFGFFRHGFILVSPDASTATGMLEY